MAGMITWHELFTTDVDRAIPFYTELLGAEIQTPSMGDFEYQMLNKDGRSHAGFVKDERGVAPVALVPVHPLRRRGCERPGGNVRGGASSSTARWTSPTCFASRCWVTRSTRASG